VCVGRGCHGLRRMSCGRDGVVASHDAISHVRFIASQARSMTQSARKVASRHGHAGAHSCTDNDRTRRDLTSARTRPIAASDQSDAPTCALDDSSRSGRASGMHVVSCGSGRPARLATEPASEGVSVGHTPGAAACGGHEARAAVVHSKSQAGFGARFRASLPCRCHPKRSTGACSSQSRGVLRRALVRQLRRQHHFRQAQCSAPTTTRPNPGCRLHSTAADRIRYRGFARA
jgi:hypothetical protein